MNRISTIGSSDATAADGLDFVGLDRDGFAILPGLVAADDLARFEHDIALLGARFARRGGVDPGGDEPLTAALRAAGRHRSMMFDHIKRLYVIERLVGDIGRQLEALGLFRHAAIEVPLLWPTLRADLPGEDIYSFPLHQDYATTRCRTAWRLWVPLRDVDEHFGTMQVAVGSHGGGPYHYITENTDYPHIDDAEVARLGFELRSFALPAGDAVLFDPRLIHGSVTNRSARTKYVMLLHLQDMANFVDPGDPDDPLQPFLALSEIHAKVNRRGR
ncbi:MAG: phytanoyl-CoA dioxygenase family protein [Dongiaceae bacterium]